MEFPGSNKTSLRITSLLLAGMLFQGYAAAEPYLTSGEVLYLPIYSDVWHGDRVVNKREPLKRPVSVMVSIRNTNLKTPIKLFSARYFDSNGNLLNQLISSPVTIDPLGTYELFVEQQESRGGSGAKLILQWEAATQVNAPIVEAIHAQIKGHSTFTFKTTAWSINGEK